MAIYMYMHLGRQIIAVSTLNMLLKDISIIYIYMYMYMEIIMLGWCCLKVLYFFGPNWEDRLSHNGAPNVCRMKGRFYCIEGVLSSECPLMTHFTV